MDNLLEMDKLLKKKKFLEPKLQNFLNQGEIENMNISISEIKMAI